MKCGNFDNKLSLFLILTSIVLIYITYQSSMDAYGQSMTFMNNTVEQHLLITEMSIMELSLMVNLLILLAEVR
jgi:hypothetical protein